jgi:hypothetical protein
MDHENKEPQKSDLEKAVEEEIERQAKRDEKLKKSGRLLSSNKKFTQVQRSGLNTMQKPGFTREQ